jgi:hypothetical protein
MGHPDEIFLNWCTKQLLSRLSNRWACHHANQRPPLQPRSRGSFLDLNNITGASFVGTVVDVTQRPASNNLPVLPVLHAAIDFDPQRIREAGLDGSDQSSFHRYTEALEGIEFRRDPAHAVAGQSKSAQCDDAVALPDSERRFARWQPESGA